MSVSAGEAKTMSGDDEYMSELKQLASQIKESRVNQDRIRMSIMKLLQRFKAQSGLGSLASRINILDMLYQDSNYISDERLRERFQSTLRQYKATLEEQLDNPITLTQKFIAVVKRIYSNAGEMTDEMFYNGESFYWIFQEKAGPATTHDNGLGTEKDYYRDRTFRNARYFVRRATNSLQQMDIDDVIQTLYFFIQDCTHFTNEYSKMYEKHQGVLKMVLRQAKYVRGELIDFMAEQKAAKKEAEDNLRLPKHIRGRIKDFIGYKLRF